MYVCIILVIVSVNHSYSYKLLDLIELLLSIFCLEVMAADTITAFFNT